MCAAVSLHATICQSVSPLRIVFFASGCRIFTEKNPGFPRASSELNDDYRSSYISVTVELMSCSPTGIGTDSRTAMAPPPTPYASMDFIIIGTGA